MQYYLFVDTSKHVPNNWAGGRWYPASLPVEFGELDGLPADESTSLTEAALAMLS